MTASTWLPRNNRTQQRTESKGVQHLLHAFFYGYKLPMWKIAKPNEFQDIVEMCQSLYREDPSTHDITNDQIMTTLETLHKDPSRGIVVSLQLDNKIQGYAFLIAFWSNELGGELCVIDELYVNSKFRGQGHASSLIKALSQDGFIWPRKLAAIELEVTPKNERARKLYSNLGFQSVRNSMMRFYK